jgi:hypothetical protein
MAARSELRRQRFHWLRPFKIALPRALAGLRDCGETGF